MSHDDPIRRAIEDYKLNHPKALAEYESREAEREQAKRDHKAKIKREQNLRARAKGKALPIKPSRDY